VDAENKPVVVMEKKEPKKKQAHRSFAEDVE
jgi:hypothetical protein